MRKIFFLPLILAACTTTKAPVTVADSGRSALTGSTVINGKLFTSVYQQKSAEYKALCVQAYNMARWKLDKALASGVDKRYAIITDVDETILDNSQYAIHRALKGLDYEPTSWMEWVERADADTVPGAPAFFRYAASRGVEVFYVTNRLEKERNGTMKNLDAYHLPNSDSRHLIMKEGISSKEVRRNEIERLYHVVLYIGDNLADFNAAFDKRSTEERADMVSKFSLDFGEKYILLPNPVYGDWESALYNNTGGLSAAQKDSLLRTIGKWY